MTPVESVAYVAAGFVPTLIALELAWRMGKHGEIYTKIRAGLR